MRKAAKSEHAVLGGCLIGTEDPDRYCKGCGHRWRSDGEADEEF
jgi:hypothetical protein